MGDGLWDFRWKWGPRNWAGWELLDPDGYLSLLLPDGWCCSLMTADLQDCSLVTGCLQDCCSLMVVCLQECCSPMTACLWDCRWRLGPGNGACPRDGKWSTLKGAGTDGLRADNASGGRLCCSPMAASLWDCRWELECEPPCQDGAQRTQSRLCLCNQAKELEAGSHLLFPDGYLPQGLQMEMGLRKWSVTGRQRVEHTGEVGRGLVKAAQGRLRLCWQLCCSPVAADL